VHGRLILLSVDTLDSSAAALPSIVDGVRRSLDPRAIPLARLIGKITAACVGVGLAAVVAIVWTAARPSTPMLALMAGGWFAVVGVLAWWLHRWAAISHRHASYTVHGEGVEIRRGVWWRTVISIPRSRVQHTDVAQGPLERRYGLGTLAIYTAGREHAKVDLHGLDHQTAFAIRDHLLPQAEVDAV